MNKLFPQYFHWYTDQENLKRRDLEMKWTNVEVTVQHAFKAMVEGFHTNRMDEPIESLVDTLLKSYKNIYCRPHLKILAWKFAWC
jgi:hypothetical protein